MDNKRKVSNLDIHCLKNNRISNRTNDLRDSKVEKDEKSKVSQKSKNINENDIRQIGKNSLLEKYKKQKIEYNNIMKEFEEKKQEQANLVKEYENQKNEQANLIKEFEQQKKEQEKIIKEYEKQKKEQEKIIKGYEAQKKEQEKIIKGYESKKEEQENLIKQFENKKTEQADLIKEYEEKYKEKESLINKYEKQKKEQTNIIKEYESQKKEQENLIKEFEQKNKEKEELIKKYQKQVEEYEKLNQETNEQLKKIKAKENIKLAKIKQKEEMQELKLTRKRDKANNSNVKYRINSRGEKRRIIVSIPVVSLVLFAILIYLLGNEIYSTYKQKNIDDVIVDFNKQVEQNLVVNEDNNNTNVEINSDASIGMYVEEDGAGGTGNANSEDNYQNYNIIANLNIPSLGIEYPVLSETTDELLKVSITKYWGPEPNEVGNLVILGHNYQTNKFFSKLNQINMGDVIELTDLSNRTLKYTVYQTQVIDPNDNSCTSQVTDGRTELTLITCYNYDASRFVVKARVE